MYGRPALLEYYAMLEFVLFSDVMNDYIHENDLLHAWLKII